jgi:flagellar biosynthesis GTPase FlhF
LIITHLDEESRWGKLWNLVLGTNYPIRWLSTGQNIPGDFCAATAETLLARQFPPPR